MTTPPRVPPGEPPDEPPRWPPQPPGGPPPGWQPPPPPPPPPRDSTGMVIGLTVVGVAAYAAINLVLGFVILAIASNGGTVALAIGAALLALIAFGGGALLIALRKPWAKGLGLGLMIGWALVSIVTVGFCTGINPSLYTGGF